ncbi:MAG: alginate export family protein [Leptolyngbyaceae bacterium]|nr:alginate export family protein [Leptolyngbyaceae bacterium]
MMNFQVSRWAKWAPPSSIFVGLLAGLMPVVPAMAQENDAPSTRPQAESLLVAPSLIEPVLTTDSAGDRPDSQGELLFTESPDSELTLAETSDTEQSEIEQSGIGQSDTEQPDTEQYDIEQPDTEQPNTEQAETEESVSDPMVLFDANGWTIRSHLQFGVNAVSESNLFWNLADTFAPDAGFDSDQNWLEFYIKPGISFTGILENEAIAYGMISAVASGTLGTDAYDTGDTGRVTLEEGYVGLRSTYSTGPNFDFSVGPRQLRLGTGMLIANGASNGFERGALKFGPRKAWELAAIGRLFQGDWAGTFFYLDPNELPSNNSETSLAGVDFRYDRPNGNYVGLTYANVLESNAAYPQAAFGGNGPPTITLGAREGLNALNFYGRVNPFQGSLEPLFFATDAAYEWNSRIDQQAWAGRVQLGYTFHQLPWTPTLTYSYQTFSGDDPSTSELERFDPLYYEGSPSSWATGSKSSMVFINSNVQAHQVALRLSPSQTDTITLRYAHIRANELRSPVQFGQATRFDFSNGFSSVISGVTDPHLSDDFFLEYNRVLNRNIFLTTGVSVSIPGEGINAVLDTDAPYWYGGFVNMVFNF